MSKLIVEIRTILEVNPHDNADRLEQVVVGGWNCVVKKGEYKVGDRCVFIPPDAMLPPSFYEMYGVKNYLGQIPSNHELATQGYMRVRATRLRGIPSYGLLIPYNEAYDNQDLVSYWNIQKWEPPAKEECVDAEKENPHFHKYTDVENIRNYPNILKNNELVLCFEKCHGSSIRTGIIEESDESGNLKPVWASGSHNMRRKPPEGGNKSKYWIMYEHEGIKAACEYFYSEIKKPILFFAELYGIGVQDCNYGVSPTFGVFDISIGGEYVSTQQRQMICTKYNIPQLPLLYSGPFSMEKIKELTDGPTTIGSPTTGFKGREGIVVRPTEERRDWEIGRVILKSISVDYLERKNPTDSH